MSSEIYGFAVMKDLGALNSWLSATDLAECCATALEHGVEIEHVSELVRRRGLPMPERARCLEKWPRPLRIETLGELAVVRDGERLRPSRKTQKKPLELLRVLVDTGRAGLAAAAEALWPDAEGDAAHHALETAVYRLRKLLGYRGRWSCGTGVSSSTRPRCGWMRGASHRSA